MGEKRGMKALELWCKRVTDGYQGVKVENMTTSWRDGLAFCALIHHFRPDLIDFSSLKKSNVYVNNELAFRTAERHLGIPALLDAEDMVEYEVPDRLSILTYLSQFYQTFASHPSSPVKRSPDSPDHSLVLSTPVSSPPTKEARRREPCFACELPVFLAQRLLVGGHLYHRTCFRCARCTAQLTLANCYETQDGVYCCETCPDEEMGPQELGDKGGGLDEPPPPAHARLMADHKTDPLVTSRAASLVGLRRMMFENIAHTDDEKLPKGRRPSECNGSNERPNKNSFSNKEPVELSRNNSDRLSVVPSVKSQSSVIKSDSDTVTLSSSDNCRPKLVVSQYSLDEISVTTEICDKDEFSSLNITEDSNIVETENSDVTSAHSKLDVDSDLEPNSCSSDLSVVQAKNDVINNSDDEIEYNKLIESRESIENKLVEAKNDVVVKVLDKEDNKSLSSEREALLSHAESGSLKQPEEQVTRTEETFTKNEEEVTQNVELVKNIAEEVSKTTKQVTRTEEIVTKSVEDVSKIAEEVSKTTKQVTKTEEIVTKSVEDVSKIAEDEFTSLTHNIEQLVIDAKNEEMVIASIENEEPPQEIISDKENVIVSEPRVPTPLARVVKHKPPTPQKRDVRKVSIESKGKKPQEDYPEDLNPFGDDDEEEEKPSASSNPFGSSDEEEEDSKSSNIDSENVPTPAARRVLAAPKINLNPFWSGDEDEDEEESSTPVPKPRKLRTPQPSPQPSPQPRRLRSATGTMGSATSIASRKKKPAPLPPNWQSTGSRKLSAPRPPPGPRTVTPSPPPLPACSPPGSPPPLDKDTKQLYNRQRQNSIVSESSSIGTISSYTPHKSTFGQWKRKKGPAPARPVPVRRAVQPMPLASVRQELQDIEIKQLGLERQGVKLEQTIRDKFEQEGASLTPYVEEMVLQLFELVNEKNEMFRRQAELMYLRRQHNLEEEHAELEYQIRCLMLCPDHNKTDSDKAREEQLIQRLVEVVERRNEIIDCLEMDRLREKEEDSSVGTQLGIFSAAVGSEVDLRVKSDKKGKKTKKEKKWNRRDGEKDMEEVGEKKKNKKKWFTLPHKS